MGRRPKGASQVVRATLAPSGGEHQARRLAAAARGSELDGLAQVAHFHGVEGYIHRAVGDCEGVPAAERRALGSLRMGTIMVHLRRMNDLKLVRDTFLDAGIPWLVFKGPVLAERIHGAVELRSYGDVDVLVDPRRLGDAIDALEAAGGVTLDRNWDLLCRTLKGEIHVRLPSGTTLDLHWHMLNSARLRERFPVDVFRLLDETRQVTVGGFDVPTLGPADSIIYVSLHAMLSGGHRLVWLKDVERLLAVEPWTPDEVESAARHWGARLVFLTALQRVAHVIGVPPVVSQSFRWRLRDRPWAALAAATWRLSAVEHERGRGSVGRLVSRSVRQDGLTSLGELARRSAGFLRDGGNRVAPIDRTSMDPSDPGSILFAAGGERAKHEYLTAVATQGVRRGG